MKRDLFSALSSNQADFFIEGAEYYQRYLQMIRDSRKTVHLQTYIFEMDGFGSLVYQELVAAANRGVDCPAGRP